MTEQWHVTHVRLAPEPDNIITSHSTLGQILRRAHLSSLGCDMWVWRCVTMSRGPNTMSSRRHRKLRCHETLAQLMEFNNSALDVTMRASDLPVTASGYKLSTLSRNKISNSRERGGVTQLNTRNPNNPRLLLHHFRACSIALQHWGLQHKQECCMLCSSRGVSCAGKKICSNVACRTAQSGSTNQKAWYRLPIRCPLGRVSQNLILCK